MAAKEKEYRRLPGRGVRRQGIATAARARLWLGRDHLLSVAAQWFSEDYKRFYFRDIQAIIIRKTNVGRNINAVLGILACLTLILAAITSDAASVFWWIITGAFAAFLLGNALMGPTCVCHLQTAVQTEELPTLRRLGRVRKVLARLRPLIAAAQGELTREEIVARTAQPPIATRPADVNVPSAAGDPFNSPLQPPGP
jgi:hypothetical protein